jgi:predicted transcriptional regulator YheO
LGFDQLAHPFVSPGARLFKSSFRNMKTRFARPYQNRKVNQESLQKIRIAINESHTIAIPLKCINYNHDFPAVVMVGASYPYIQLCVRDRPHGNPKISEAFRTVTVNHRLKGMINRKLQRERIENLASRKRLSFP